MIFWSYTKIDNNSVGCTIHAVYNLNISSFINKSTNHVPVAQLDSAAPSEGAGRRFESALGRQLNQGYKESIWMDDFKWG